MFLVKVYVSYKESILDPQGEAIKKAIHGMGYNMVEEVRMGKYFELRIVENDRAGLEEKIDDICDKLLANVTMESYRYEIEVE
ncbi:phosphoribosylformylglycinamidine synthase subunit PurS [Ignavigranum ruoffiae]|uniref:phosphoribosylformylglycinamidine synthase subunit PurS n=1 Tax=Ignavigranum ruoffiae TaxID=89093 RepID=UPI0020663617|nr:phosphoribosylformylglycinamidine synthase subunit PurS [Ignavigranum ruoffiae]UPQ85191.1 phosphoribosylformylglycinamidine synthase subunit PurS [Ignavigranum ruoffiae]